MRNGNAITGVMAALPISLAMWVMIAMAPILGVAVLLVGVGWLAVEVRWAGRVRRGADGQDGADGADRQYGADADGQDADGHMNNAGPIPD